MPFVGARLGHETPGSPIHEDPKSGKPAGQRAEGEGFEPSGYRYPAVFKTAALGHYASPPVRGDLPTTVPLPVVRGGCATTVEDEAALQVHYDALMDQDAAELSTAIGMRVKQERQARRWTLDQLSDAAGVSRRALVNVEQGSANPSIATLLRLSDALGIGLPELVDTAGDAAQPVTVHRAAEARPMWTSPNGGSAVMVAATRDPYVSELWDWRLGPGDTHRSEAHRAGTHELLLVLTGTVALTVGDTGHRLVTGDSARFDGGVPHAYRNPSGTRPARFTLAVVEAALAKDSS